MKATRVTEEKMKTKSKKRRKGKKIIKWIIILLIIVGIIVVVVKVKSGKNASHKSLDKFVAKFPSYVAKPYLLWMKDRKTQAGVEYLPIYMAPCLAES